VYDLGLTHQLFIDALDRPVEANETLSEAFKSYDTKTL